MAKAKDRVEDMKPYVERALKDEDLRENVVSAYAAAKEVYNELLGNRGVAGVATRVATDKDVQENLRTTIDELRKAADRLQGKEDHKGRNSTLLIAGIALGILFNPMTGPATRTWIRERLFGSDDDFTYQGGSTGGGGNSNTSA